MSEFSTDGGISGPDGNGVGIDGRRRYPLIDLRIIDLILYKTFADLRAEAAKTYVNFLWWMIDPILTMLVFYVVFGLIAKRGDADFLPFLLTGLVAWTWYKQTVSHAGNAIMGSRGLITQVHVPKIVFPSVTVLMVLIKFAFVLAMLLVFLWLFGFGITASYAALPAVLFVQLLFSIALTYLVAGLVPFLPDLRLLIENLLQLQFFLSGIFFSGDSVPQAYQSLFYLNPMASLIHDYRAVLLYDTWPHWGRLGMIALFSLALMSAAVALIHRFDRQYPRMVR